MGAPNARSGTNTYVVSYDICDPKRLRRVFKAMKGWGMHIQYSVFQCDLSKQSLIELQSELDDLIDHHTDQILFINVGPTTGRARSAISALGKPLTPMDRAAIVV